MDKKSILKDILSPSHLWSVFQFGFPTGAAAVSGVLSYLWHLPPSVILLLALISAACGVIIVDAAKKASARGKLTLNNFGILHFVPNVDGQSLVQMQVLVINSSPELPLYFEIEVLNLSLQEKTNTVAENLGPAAYVPPLSSKNVILPALQGIGLGEVKGCIHLRILYGKTPQQLNIRDEWRYNILGAIYEDESKVLYISCNFFLREYVSS